jgi:hypothetical protein
VILGHGADIIVLQTNLPESVWPFEGQASVRMSAARGSGIDYVRQHLGIEPAVTERVHVANPFTDLRISGLILLSEPKDHKK